MKTWVRKTLSVGVLAAGALLFAPGAAHADTHQNTWDNNGLLNGTQLVAPISVPLNIVGNAIGVAGEANAAGAGQNWVTESGKNGKGGKGGVSQDSWDNNGVLNGTQLYVPVSVPVNIVGNSLGILGEANAAGSGVNQVGRKAESATTESKKRHGNGHGGPTQDSWDNNGILNGTQIYSPVDIPINICGNSLALLGEANSQAICGNAISRNTESGWAVSQDSHDNNGVLNGTQVYAPLSIPVNLAGNSGALLGEGNAAASAVNESGHGGGFSQDSSDNNGIGNGTQIAAPISVPINICGNALGILGEANASAACANGIGDLVGGGQGNGGHHGNGGNGGHHGNGGNGGDNGGVNGGGDYMGDHGHQGTGNGAGNGGYGGNGAGNGDTGSDSSSTGGRMASGTEASPVSALTQGAGSVGSLGLGGLDLLSTLR
jgi:hypothetical protein